MNDWGFEGVSLEKIALLLGGTRSVNLFLYHHLEKKAKVFWWLIQTKNHTLSWLL